MHAESNLAVKQEGKQGSLFILALLAPLVGAASGLLGATFRLALDQVDLFRDTLIARAHEVRLVGFLFVVAASAGAVAIAAWLVRRFSPPASGSGIPHVEAVLTGELPPAPAQLIPVKFFGGLLAIGAGLALGREGPSVQMGAAIADLIGRICRLSWSDRQVLLAAGACGARDRVQCADCRRRFRARGTGAAVRCAHRHRRARSLGRGDRSGTHAARLCSGSRCRATGLCRYSSVAVFCCAGRVAGLVATFYNRTLLGAIHAAERLGPWPVELKAGVIGATVGILAWFAPGLVGGGDNITQHVLAGEAAVATIPLAFLLRFGLGAVSYAVPIPGGLFAPMLVLGAQLGMLFGASCGLAFPEFGIEPEQFAVVGMAAFFAGVVQAPVTGIVLVTEMTGGFTMFLPMLAACFSAMLVPTLLHSAPIYESLRARMVRRQQIEDLTRTAGARSGNSR